MAALSSAVYDEFIKLTEVSAGSWGAAGSGGTASPADALSAGAAHPWGEFGVTNPLLSCHCPQQVPTCLLVGLPECIGTRGLIFLEKNAVMSGTLASRLW